MGNNSDPMFDRFADLDFSDAKPVGETPALARLQAEQGGKTPVTMQIDNNTLAVFKARAEMSGSDYSALMNDALKQFAESLRMAS
jgi:uncharacterized protein (DUF4415 family)